MLYAFRMQLPVVMVLALAAMLAGTARAESEAPPMDATAIESLDFGGDLANPFVDALAGDADAVETGPYKVLSGKGEVPVRTVWQATAARPGEKLVLALVFEIPDDLHIYPDATQFRPDTIGTPTTVVVREASDELTFEGARFPLSHIKDGPLGPAPSYEGQTVIYLAAMVSPAAEPGEYHATIEVVYGACDDVACFEPSNLEVPVTLTVVASDSEIAPIAAEDADLFADYIKAGNQIRFDVFGWMFTVDASNAVGVALVMLLALVGGFLLNLTPCVLPVIPIKIMSLSQSAANRAKCFMLGAVMATGVVAFWLFLGGAIAVSSHLFAKGTGITTTNQLFQYPSFTITIGIVIAAMAVGMCGLFAVRLPNWVYTINPKHDSIFGSLGFGMMTAVLSTPCTAPFMGAAAAWAATQNPMITLATFAAVGIGMALPYLILAANPKLVDRMPRTGPASELIKQVMGLLMLAAAAFFIGTGVSGWLSSLRPADPPTKLYWWPVMLLIAAAGGWLIYRTWQITPRPTRRAIFATLGVIFIVGGIYGGVRLTDKGPVNWVYYTPDRLAAAQEKGDVIVLDFTAETCINCKVLEHTFLYQPQVASLLNSEGVTAMKVDLTGNKPLGRAKLNEHGRASIPLLVIYAPDGREVFKSDAYTAEQVLQALAEARTTSTALAN